MLPFVKTKNTIKQNKMNLETKFKKETGFDAYENNDSRPKVPSNYYVEWLEEKLTLTDVSQQNKNN